MAIINSAQSGNFSDPSTWVGGVVPSSADRAVAATGHVITIDQNLTLESMTNAGTGYFLMTGSTPYNITCSLNTIPATSASASLFIFDENYSAVGTQFDFTSTIGSQTTNKNGLFEFLAGSSGDFTNLGTITASTTSATNVYGIYSLGHTDITLETVRENSVKGAIYFSPDDYATLVVNDFGGWNTNITRGLIMPNTINEYADITINAPATLSNGTTTSVSFLGPTIYGSLTINGNLSLRRVGSWQAGGATFFTLMPGSTLIINGDQSYLIYSSSHGTAVSGSVLSLDNPELVRLGSVTLSRSYLNTVTPASISFGGGVGNVELTGDSYSASNTGGYGSTTGLSVDGDITFTNDVSITHQYARLFSATNIYVQGNLTMPVAAGLYVSGTQTALDAADSIIVDGDFEYYLYTSNGSTVGTYTGITAGNEITINGNVIADRRASNTSSTRAISTAAVTTINGDVIAQRSLNVAGGSTIAVNLEAGTTTTINGDIYHGESANAISTTNTLAISGGTATTVLNVYGDMYSSYNATLVSVGSISPDSDVQSDITSYYEGTPTNTSLVTGSMPIGSYERTVRLTPSLSMTPTGAIARTPGTVIEYVLFDADGNPQVYTGAGNGLMASNVRSGVEYATGMTGIVILPPPSAVDASAMVDQSSGTAVLKASTLANINGSQIAGLSN